MKIKPLFLVCLALILSLLSACGPQIQTIGADEYYVEIQSEGEANTEQGNTRYEYEMNGYNEDGEEKNLIFTSNHELRQNAYLRIYVKKDEVITYEEVETDDIPNKAQQLLEDENHA